MLSDYWWTTNFTPIWVRKNWYYSMISNYNILPGLLLPPPRAGFHLIPTAKMSSSPKSLLYCDSINRRRALPLPTTPFPRWSASLSSCRAWISLEDDGHIVLNNIVWVCDVPEPSGMLTASFRHLPWFTFERLSILRVVRRELDSEIGRLWMWDSSAVVWYCQVGAVLMNCVLFESCEADICVLNRWITYFKP